MKFVVNGYDAAALRFFSQPKHLFIALFCVGYIDESRKKTFRFIQLRNHPDVAIKVSYRLLHKGLDFGIWPPNFEGVGVAAQIVYHKSWKYLVNTLPRKKASDVIVIEGKKPTCYTSLKAPSSPAFLKNR